MSFVPSITQTARLVLATLILAAGPQALANFAGGEGATKADRDATLNFFIASFPKTLNPVISTSADENSIIKDYTIFESLIAIDPDSGEPVCWLCTDYSYDKNDKRVVTFNLRKGMKWHDGKPMTANDVKMSYEIMVHPKVDNLAQKTYFIDTVEKVEAVNDTTVKITFKKDQYTNIFNMEVMPIVPAHLFPYFAKEPEKFNKDQKFGRNPVGSGPYKFKKWQAGKFVELQRNDDWWGFKDGDRFKNTFNFKRLRFKIVTNDNVAMQAFRKGEFDYMSLQSYQYDDLRKEKNLKRVKPVHLVPKLNASFMFIAWNGRQGRFSDAKTKQALGMMMDRFSALEKFSRGLRPPTNGPWGVNSDYSCSVEECPILPYDPKAAGKLLSEAGWKDSDKDGCLDRTRDGKKETLKFSILAGQGDYYKNVLGVYTTEMKRNGVCASIRQLDWTAMTKLVDDLNFDSFFSGFRAGFPLNPRQLWHSQNTEKTGSNSWYFVNKEADKLIGQFEAEYDDTKRKALGRQIHKLIYNSHAVTFHHESGGCYVGRNENLQGLEVANYRPDCHYWPRWYKTSDSKSH